MVIKVLGSGCTKCNKLEQNVHEALKEANIEATVEKVSDIAEIMNYGVMMTPALVVDEEVKSMGKLLKPKDIIKILQK